MPEVAAWPAGGPRKLWDITLAKGYGSLAIKGGRIYVLGTPGKGSDLSRASTYCLDADTGKVVWEHTIEKTRDVTAATPTVVALPDGDKIVSAGPNGEIVCLRAEDGEQLWELRLNLKSDPYCYGSSPLVHKSKVFLQAGPNIRALDLAEGKELWKTPWGIPGGGGRWTSPVLGVFEGRETLVCLSRSQLLGLDPGDGKELWKVVLEEEPSGEDLCNTPAIVGRSIVCLAFRGGAARDTKILRVDIQEGQPKEVWRSASSGNRSQSPTVFGDCVYLPSLVNGKTPLDKKGVLKCYDFATGKMLWSSSDPQARSGEFEGGPAIWNDGGAFLMAGVPGQDGRVVLLDGTGHVTLSAVNAHGCTVLGDVTLGPQDLGAPKDRGPMQSSFQYLTPPLMVGGRLYVRNHDRIVCYTLRD